MTDVHNQNNTQNSSTSSNSQNPTAAASAIASGAKEQVSAFASDALDKAKDLQSHASSSTAGLKDKASDLVDSAKGMAAQSGDKILGALEEQKSAGADKVSGFADAMRRAADELDKELPPAANLVRQAADQIDAASDAVRNRDFRQLAGTVQDFARRQPAAFLGLTVLAGFAAVRLLKVPVATATESAQTNRSGNAIHSVGMLRPSGASGEFNRS